MAAMASNKKNRIDHSWVAGMLAKTSGRVTKTNVAPRSPSPASPNDVTAGNMIKPIMTDTERSSIDTVSAVRVNFVFLGK